MLKGLTALIYGDVALKVNHMFTPADAAIKTGVTRATILHAIRSGRLFARKNNIGYWQIDPIDLANWKKLRMKNRVSQSKKREIENPNEAQTKSSLNDIAVNLSDRTIHSLIELGRAEEKLRAKETEIERLTSENKWLREEISDLKIELKNQRDSLAEMTRAVIKLSTATMPTAEFVDPLETRNHKQNSAKPLKPLLLTSDMQIAAPQPSEQLEIPGMERLGGVEKTITFSKNTAADALGDDADKADFEVQKIAAHDQLPSAIQNPHDNPTTPLETNKVSFDYEPTLNNLIAVINANDAPYKLENNTRKKAEPEPQSLNYSILRFLLGKPDDAK